MVLQKIPTGVKYPLFKGVELINKAIEAADKADVNAAEALIKAIESLNLSEQTQKELTQAILAGDSSPLGGQLSVGSDGTVYDGPQERLIAENEKVMSSLAQKLTEEDLANIDEQFIQTNENISELSTYFFGGEIGTNTSHTAEALVIPTYDGSGQAVHPDVLYVPEGFNGWKYWMAYTPYPNGNDNFENPSITVSNDGVNWKTPTGLTNPIVPALADANDYNSDPDLLLHNNTLYLYYRETKRSVTPTENRIFLRTSTDGITWSAPTQVLFNSGVADAIMSPSVIVNNGTFEMWVVDGWGNLVKKTSTDGITWSASQQCTTIGMPTDRNYWHVDVAKNGERLDMLLCSSTASGGTGARLQYAYSDDGGLTWTTSEPFIEPLYDFENSLQYRGTIVKQGNVYDIWYSCSSTSGVWSIAYMKAIVLNNQLIPLYPSDYRNSEVKAKQDLRGKSAWLFLAANQSISTGGALTALNWTSAYDDLGFFDPTNPSRLRIPAGVKKIKITVGLLWDSNNTGDRTINISKNGSVSASGLVAATRTKASSSSEMNISSPVLPFLAEGDYFQVYAWQDSGVALNVVKTNRTFASIEVVE